MTNPSRTIALLGAGILTALSILTKTSAGFLIPFTLLTLLTFVTYCLRTGRPAGWSGRQWLVVTTVWTGGVIFAFLCLWPAAWQDPAAALARLLNNVEAVVTTPHENAIYFLGRAWADPGWLYYWVVLLFRLTPLTLPLGLLAGAFLAGDALHRRWRIDATLMLVALLYAVLFLAMMSLAAKKQERYILPAVLAIDVLAAWALARLLDWLRSVQRIGPGMAQRYVLRWGAVGLILLVSLWWFRLHPHYYAYQNPLVGGSPAANWAYLTGWGEGNELAAAYLNRQPDAADLVTVASFDVGVAAYTPGVTLWTSPQTMQLADYAVLYEGTVRRDLFAGEWIGALAGRQPVYTVFLDGVPYVKVYALTDQPRRLLSWRLPAIQHPQPTSVGGNLTYLGYDGEPAASASGNIALTLYWQCVQPVSRDYTVFIHLMDPASGRRQGQWDSVPVGGRFPTSWWLPGLVIRDDVAVTVPAATPPGEYELWLGLYEVQTGQRLPVGEPGAGRDHVVLGRVTIAAR
jgi:4-amino-4-deoxy-L-arabinose transferase-like glycosyltransferase